MPAPVCFWKHKMFMFSVWSLFAAVDLSLFRFITTELTRGYFLEHNEAKYTERRERVYTCLRIPKELEKVNIKTHFLQLHKNVY